MKAKPVIIADGRCTPCTPGAATHVILNMPGPLPYRHIPVILKGTRAGTNCWTWNGDTEKPTLKPSIRTRGGKGVVCHTFVNDGKVKFLTDCSHELAGQTLDLLDVDL